MLRATLLVWCLLLASFNYNAQFATGETNYQGYNPYSLGDYFMTDPSIYYQPFYHPMYEQDQYYAVDGEDEDQDYSSSPYFRGPGIKRLNGTGKIGKPNRLNVAGRPSIGNRPNRPLGSKPTRPNAAGRPNRPNNIAGRPGKPIRCKWCQNGALNPGGTGGFGGTGSGSINIGGGGLLSALLSGSNFNNRPGILNLLRQILLNWISFLAALFPNLFTSVTSTQTVTQLSTCTISTTACAGRRRRAVIENLLDQVTSSNQQISTSIAPEIQSSIAAMELLSETEDDPELYLDSIYSDEDQVDYTDLQGSMQDPQEEDEQMKKFKKQVKMSPLRAAMVAKQLGINTITFFITTTITTTTKLTPTCSTQGTFSQCP